MWAQTFKNKQMWLLISSSVGYVDVLPHIWDSPWQRVVRHRFLETNLEKKNALERSFNSKLTHIPPTKTTIRCKRGRASHGEREREKERVKQNKTTEEKTSCFTFSSRRELAKMGITRGQSQEMFLQITTVWSPEVLKMISDQPIKNTTKNNNNDVSRDQSAPCDPSDGETIDEMGR